MGSRFDRQQDSKLNEKHSKILKELMTRPDNKKCADCRKKDPRWASWNLGIFVCIQCSGIHRSIGTHISKVKSADLDTWTPEQVENMIKWGNEKANAYWEHEWPKDTQPSERNMDQFIRAKYERKQYAMRGAMPDPSTLGSNASATSSVGGNASHLFAAFESAPVKKPQSSTQQLFDAFQAPPSTQPTQQEMKNSILSLYGNAKPAATATQNNSFGAFASSLVPSANNGMNAQFANFAPVQPIATATPPSNHGGFADFGGYSTASKMPLQNTQSVQPKVSNQDSFAQFTPMQPSNPPLTQQPPITGFGLGISHTTNCTVNDTFGDFNSASTTNTVKQPSPSSFVTPQPVMPAQVQSTPVYHNAAHVEVMQPTVPHQKPASSVPPSLQAQVPVAPLSPSFATPFSTVTPKADPFGDIGTFGSSKSIHSLPTDNPWSDFQ